MKYVLFYESADDVSSSAPLHYPAHRARFQDFHSRGLLLMIGIFGDSPEEGAMAIFTTREAAEVFAAGDPLVLHGIVRAWRIRAWSEVLT